MRFTGGIERLFGRKWAKLYEENGTVGTCAVRVGANFAVPGVRAAVAYQEKAFKAPPLGPLGMLLVFSIV